MKMKKAALIAGILGAVIIGSSITITQQNEYKLIRQFGKVDRVICEPGISFKIPLIERTVTAMFCGESQIPLNLHRL